jgi:hypothetical protein
MTKEDFDLWVNAPSTKEFLVRLSQNAAELSERLILTRATTEGLAGYNEIRGQILTFKLLTDKAQLEEFLVRHEGE